MQYIDTDISGHWTLDIKVIKGPPNTKNKSAVPLRAFTKP
jgi:hypothetical protein